MAMLEFKKYTNVYKLLLGRVATNVADSLFYMAILWHFKEIAHSPLLVSIIFTISSGIDMISFSFGPIIDNFSIKELLKKATIIQAIIDFIIVGILITNTTNKLIDVIVLSLFAISTIISSIIYPAEYKLLPALVSENEVLKFNGLFQVTYQVLDMILDAGVTIVITLTSINFTIILSAVIFGMALLCYNSLQINKAAKDILEDDDYFTGSYIKDIVVGWNTLYKEKNILELIFPIGVVNFFYGIFAVGLPYFAQDYVQKSAIGYGALLFASSIGSVIGAFFVQRFKLKKEDMRIFVAICFLGAGIFRIIVPLTVSLNVLILLISSAISSMWITMMNINFEALVQVSFSSAVLGRVQTINDSILSIMIPIGTLIGGWILKEYGPLATQYIYGVALICSAIYYFLVIKKK